MPRTAAFQIGPKPRGFEPPGARGVARGGGSADSTAGPAGRVVGGDTVENAGAAGVRPSAPIDDGARSARARAAVAAASRLSLPGGERAAVLGSSRRQATPRRLRSCIATGGHDRLLHRHVERREWTALGSGQRRERERAATEPAAGAENSTTTGRRRSPITPPDAPAPSFQGVGRRSDRRRRRLRGVTIVGELAGVLSWAWSPRHLPGASPPAPSR